MPKITDRIQQTCKQLGELEQLNLASDPVATITVGSFDCQSQVLTWSPEIGLEKKTVTEWDPPGDGSLKPHKITSVHELRTVDVTAVEIVFIVNLYQ